MSELPNNIAALGMLSDTSRVDASALGGADERYRLLVDALDEEAILLVDEGGRIATWSRGAAAIFGFAGDEMLGRPVERLIELGINPPPRPLDDAPPPPRTRSEGWMLRKDGARFWGEESLLRLDGGGFALVIRDETARHFADEERRRAVEAAERARLEAETAIRAKDEFIAAVSHDLRTPLTAILGWARVLRSRVHDEAATARALEVIERNAKQQARIIDDLLDVSRILRGTLRLDKLPLELGAIVEAALAGARPQAASKNVTLATAPSDEPVRLHGDPLRLEQVLGNLLQNAIKFTPPGGHVRVELRRGAVVDSVEIAVRDDGEGVPPERLPSLFDRFRSLQRTAARHHGGMGLGLVIVRHIVELHGGSVRAESDGPGRGASFIVTLPVTDASPLRPPSPHAPAATLPSAGPLALAGRRVLLVEDQDDVRELLGEVMRNRGAHVYACASAQRALEAIASGWRADVIVSDIGMEGVDGCALLERLRAFPDDQGGSVPAIALTGFTRAEDRDRILAAGYQVHIAKPVEPTALVAAVASLVKRAA